MKRIIAVAAFALVASTAATPGAIAAPEKFTFDKSHTRIGFNVNHLFTRVHGHFNEYDGVILFDAKDPTNSVVEVTIQTASVDTKHEKRDADLRSENFFEVEKYPTMTFKSGKVTAAGENRYSVAGDLTIRGVTKPVTLDVELLGVSPFSMGGREMGVRAGFTASTAIQRKDFGIVWNRTLDNGGVLVGDEVRINIDVGAVKAPPEAAKPAAAGATTSDKK